MKDEDFSEQVRKVEAASAKGTLPREVAILSAENAIVEDLAGTVQAFSEAMATELGGLRGSMDRLGASFDAAAAASDRAASRLTWWTAVLAFATVVLAGATVALVWATLRLGPISN